MSIHINCPNCHILSSLTLSKLSAQAPITTRPAFREHPDPTADLSDIPIDSAMQFRHLVNPQHHMAMHGHSYHMPGHVVNPNYAGSPNLPTPYRQPQQINWERFGIPTRDDGDAKYAIHRAVRYAYDKGYEDAKKSKKGPYYSLRKVLEETDRKELDELKDRLVLERMGELTLASLSGSTASWLREVLGTSQRHEASHKGKQQRKHRDRSRARSHHPRNPCHNHPHLGKRVEDARRCVCGNCEDTDSSESSDGDHYVYR